MIPNHTVINPYRNEDYAACYAAVKDPARYTFILTGKFGAEFLMWMNRCSRPYGGYILFGSDLRDRGAARPLFSYMRKPNEWTRHAVFVDDEFITGGTRQACLATLSVPDTIRTIVLGAPDVMPVWITVVERELIDGNA